VQWQVQDAKQRFSELLRVAHVEGPQFVTRHGREVAVVIDIAQYRHLKGDVADFKNYLTIGPSFDDLDLARSADSPRSIDCDEQG
jgi:prevent-host-death family protein